MAYTLILGPMKSGKSLELIARVAPYKFADKKVVFVQPEMNIRDGRIASRAGIGTKAKKVKTLEDVNGKFDVIGIDEAHMFDEADYIIIKKWLKEDKEVVISGLDLDYRAKMIPIIKKLLELKPDRIISKQAVCQVCKNYSANYTQIIKNSKPILSGLPAIVPEDGTYIYEVRCRNCHITMQ
ncbi:MAG: hypothetical protein WCP03_00620 [Candidatus Saccharibacteria bacterium]